MNNDTARITLKGARMRRAEEVIEALYSLDGAWCSL